MIRFLSPINTTETLLDLAKADPTPMDRAMYSFKTLSLRQDLGQESDNFCIIDLDPLSAWLLSFNALEETQDFKKVWEL